MSKIKKLKKDGFVFSYRAETSDKSELKGNLTEFLIPEYGIFHDDIVIDIGAYIGTFAIPISARVGSGKIFSLEPCKDTFNILKKNIALNNIKNITPINLAIADLNKEIKLYHAPKGGLWGNSLTNDFLGKFEIVQSETLETFMKNNKISHCDFMKINCEGSEFEIILGSNKETLQKIELMLILYHEDYNKKHKKEEIIRHLKNSGFSIAIKNQTKKRGWIIAKNRAKNQ